MNANLAERMAYIACYFFEIHEESGGGGHSTLITLLNPDPSGLSLNQLRELTLGALDKGGRRSITTLALSLVRSLCSQAIQIDATTSREMLVRACQKYEHPYSTITDHEECRQRRLRRLIYLYWLMHAHGLGGHSRAVQFFFADHELWIGSSPEVSEDLAHPEHVVPCAYIRDVVLRRLGQEQLVQNGTENTTLMAELMESLTRLMSVAYISDNQAALLDTGKSAMKWSMPLGWSETNDCILARLCTVGISIEVSDQYRSRHGSTSCSVCPRSQPTPL